MEAVDWEFLLARAADRWKDFLGVLIDRAPDDARLTELGEHLGYLSKATTLPAPVPEVVEAVEPETFQFLTANGIPLFPPPLDSDIVTLSPDTEIPHSSFGESK